MTFGRLPRLAAGLAAVLSSGGVAAGYQIAGASPASAVTLAPAPDFTWSGQGQVDPSTPDPNWSNGQNWSAGAAPAANSTVGTLTFPELGTCDDTTRACENGTHDLGNLTAGALNFTNNTTNYVIYPNDPTTDGLSIGSGGITADGPTPDPANYAPSPSEVLGVPLTVNSDQTWALSNNDLNIDGGFTGTGNVTATLAQGSDLSFSYDPSGPTNPDQLGSLSVTGGQSTNTGTQAGTNGQVNLPTDLGTTPVNFTDVQVYGPSNVGPLVSAGSAITVGTNQNGGAPGNLAAAGAVSLDSNSEVYFTIEGETDTPGTTFSQLSATGAVDLGNAQLQISPMYYDSSYASQCVTPKAGDIWTLVSGSSVTGQFDDSSGIPIPDGGTIKMNDCADNPGQGAPVRINYTATAVTATFLDPTTTTVTVSPSSPEAGQPTTITATVSSQSAKPQGTVEFLSSATYNADHNYTNDIPGCENVALSDTAPYTATCTYTFNQAGDTRVSAAFNRSTTSDVASSEVNNPVDFSVRVPGSTSSVSGTSGDPSTPASATDGNATATASGGTGTVVVSQYGADPAPAPTFSSTGEYFDVRLNSGSTFSKVSVQVSGMPSGGGLYWWNASASSWQPVVGDPGPSPVNGDPTTQSVTFTANSSPNLSQLTGTIFGVSKSASPTPAPAPQPAGPGYRMVAADGGVFDFNQPFYGSTGGTKLVQPIVGMANAAAGKGYYLVARDGGVFAFGPGAKFQGSTGGVKLAQPIVGMAVDPATGGYWLVASDGGVFAFNAPFYGSTGGVKLNQPIVGITAAPGGKGYYLVARDGGIFAFGPGAHFQGSTGGTKLNQPVVGMSVDPLTGGYRLVAADGGIFSFNAPFKGSTGTAKLVKPIVGMTTDPATGGYWLVASDGGIFAFDAPFDGSTGGAPLVQPIVGMAAG
ncbi:MAG TPA: hypothetical protein VFH58_11150 [Acidimicrobiales bacterium]|nr:hypothetical protein [Acidimicrobiales bacterium]